MINQPDISSLGQDASATKSQQAQHNQAPLGKTDSEDEAGHLRRVADELGGANSGSVRLLSAILNSEETSERRAAAAALGALGDRHSIAALRALLEQDDPHGWEIAVHGLRQSRDRAGWMSLESIALDHVRTLEAPEREPLHAFRLLVMGRTKTMDRLFRAIDGHSRSLSPAAARAFTSVAVRSVPGEMATIMALRLGISGSTGGNVRAGASNPFTLEQVSLATGLQVEAVRRLEGVAWETVQRSRPYAEIRQNYEVNGDKFRSAD